MGDAADQYEIKYILSQILAYPSTELAELHELSNRLGSLDLRDEHQNKMNDS